MLSETEERRTRLTLIYGPAFRRAFEIFALGTTDSPVRDDEVIELARSAGISKEQRILEPCSGSGGVSRLLTREFRCEVLGIDVVPYQLDVAKSKAAHEGFQSLIAYIEGDAVTYAYPREAFDAAIDVFAWVHVADWPDLFRTIHGALKPGGKIVMYGVSNPKDYKTNRGSGQRQMVRSRDTHSGRLLLGVRPDWLSSHP